MRIAWSCVALVLLAACRPQPSAGVPPAAVTVAPAPGGGDPLVHTEPAPHAEPPAPPSPLPGALGKSCSGLDDAAGQGAGRRSEMRCGTRSRVALEIDHATVSLLRVDVACALQSQPNEHVGGDAARACLAGDQLYAGAQCLMCRLMDAGWSARAIVTELSPNDAHELATLLKLDDRTPLRSAADWRHALERAGFAADTAPH